MSVALAVLALGVPALLFVLWPLFTRRESDGSLPTEDERASLEADKLATLRAIRELALDHEVGHLAAADYTELRARYEGRAGAILRRLDELGPAPTVTAGAAPLTSATGPAVPWSRQPVVLGAAGVGILVFGMTLGVLVTRYTTPAPVESAAPMGAPAPGLGESAPGPGGTGTPRPIPKEVLQGMLQAAHASLDAGRYQEAIAAYKAVLRRQPTNVDAITHLGVILAAAGHADNALEAFDKALSIDPDYAHALWDKAGILFEAKHDYTGAIAAWERFARVSLPGPDRDQALARIKEARVRLTSEPRPAAAKR